MARELRRLTVLLLVIIFLVNTVRSFLGDPVNRDVANNFLMSCSAHYNDGPGGNYDEDAVDWNNPSSLNLDEITYALASCIEAMSANGDDLW